VHFSDDRSRAHADSLHTGESSGKYLKQLWVGSCGRESVVTWPAKRLSTSRMMPHRSAQL
jgi:hypothetical protein